MYFFEGHLYFHARVAPLYWPKMALAKIALAIWPGLVPKMALAMGGKAQRGQVSMFDKKCKNIKVPGMELSIVENLSAPQENMFSLSRSPKLNYR